MVDHGLVPHPLHRIIVFNQRVQSERSYSASGGCPSGCPSQPEQLLLKVRISFPVCHRFCILTSYHHLLCLGGREDDRARTLAPIKCSLFQPEQSLHSLLYHRIPLLWLLQSLHSLFSQKSHSCRQENSQSTQIKMQANLEIHKINWG